MPAVAVILKGYPRLSETFIAQEIRELERMGLDLRIVSLRHPTDREIHPVHREIVAPVSYLPEYLHVEPVRVLRAVAAVRKWPRYGLARRIWLHDVRRDRSRNRIRRFGQACVLAHEVHEDVAHLHAHFLHTPASVARYAALLLGLPWSCSAHAKDIWTTPDWEIREKLDDLDWAVTCTRSGLDRLRSLASDPDRVGLVYHGIDLTRFPPPQTSSPPHKSGGRPLVILSVGRAVEKKGYDDLLRALAMLPPELDWEFRHIGGGALGGALKAESERLGIATRTTWLGAQPQETVLREIRSADIFVLASKIAADGDRDGLPNVLMEAMSQGLPVLATRISAIPELITDGVTGVLTEPGDHRSLADALRRLTADAALRRRLGDAGASHVRNAFSMTTSIAGLSARFGLAPDPARATACE